MTEDLRKAVEESRMNYIYRNEYIRQQVALEDARDEGREEERIHTEEQRKRAEAAEEEVERLRKLLENK